MDVNFKFHSIGVATTKKLLRKISSTKSSSFDGIPAFFWKRLSQSLAIPICHLINASFEQGVYPDVFKAAKLVPVYKGAPKSRTEAASYRPVSLLPSLSKLSRRQPSSS